MLEERVLKSVYMAEKLLHRCGLKLPEDMDYTVGIYDGSDNVLLAVGSLKGDIIQGVAVDPDFQGEDLAAKVLTHLIDYAVRAGKKSLYLFTKPETALMFSSLGFRRVVEARPYAALLEWGVDRISAYVENLKGIAAKDPGEAAAIVVNCNPFTLGHQYLIETAAQNSRKVYVLVVEEDQSVFPFKDRIELVCKGTAHLDNVVVLPGGRYVVSSLTFPSYFTRVSDLAAAHSAVDVELFLHYIAPALGIVRRYIGTEPFSEVTEIYNNTIKTRLTAAGISVDVIERKAIDGISVSASKVRRLIAEKRLEETKALVPDTTYQYLKSEKASGIIKKLQSCYELKQGYIEDGGKATYDV